MAQYGRNYYGGSYYGLSGVFAGQFVSDETHLSTALTDNPPSTGKLNIGLICSHPRVTYAYPDDVYIRDGVWTDGASITSSDPAFNLTASLVASTMYINYTQRVDGAVVDVEVKTYVSGVLSATNTYTIDTMGSGPYVIDPPAFGEHVVKMTKNSGSDASSVFEFTGITAMTTDVKLEMRSQGKNGEWGDWADIPLTATESNVSYNGFSNVYKYSGETDNWSGTVGYQFKLMMASSDNQNTPEVISIDITSGNTSDYSDSGYWKSTIDLGTDADSIDNITFVADAPEGTSLEIRSRTSSIDGNWSSWSLPYSDDASRAVLDYKADPSLKAGYIMTPLISPENLTRWQSFILVHLLNYIDTFTMTATPGASINVEVVKASYNPLAPDSSDVLKQFSYINDTKLLRNISDITVPVRLKINFARTGAVASPAVEYLTTTSTAYYKEYRVFGGNPTDYKGYGSAVYGDNSGIDKVYIDGLTRNVQCTISQMGFTIPVGAENPDYVIELDSAFAETYTAEEVDIYWNSNGGKAVKLEGALTDDYLMVRVKEAKDLRRVKKHYRYGSGIATVLSPGYIPVNMTSTFSPALENGRDYAYYVKNGFVLESPNTHLDIRWKSEDLLDTSARRNVTYTRNDQVYISITQGSVGGLADWVSEEKKFEGIVNLNDNKQSYVATLLYSDDPSVSQIPDIEKEIIVNPDPSVIPYKVEVIEGSVVSHGERKPEDRLSGQVRYLYSSEATPSLTETVEVMVPVIRSAGNTDRLPKSMVKKLNGTSNGLTLGVYSSEVLFAPDYANKMNPTTGEELETGQYKYYAASGTYSNIIDWTPGILSGDAPEEGSTYYVSYMCDKVTSLRIEFTCDYSEYKPSLQIYRSDAMEYSGECSPMTDYVSDQLSYSYFTIPQDVDKSTLRFVVYDDNARVRTYIDGDRVIGTLDKKDPRDSWNPYVRGGYYYIGKDKYYMFLNENKYVLDETVIPQAENIIYTEDSSVLVQEATENLFKNSILASGSSIENVFTDTFTRI